MVTNRYLKWLSETASSWWNDSAILGEVGEAIENGSTGTTTNPVLVKRSLYDSPESWSPYLKDMEGFHGDEKAEELTRRVTKEIAEKYRSIYKATKGIQGYVCAQVNPKYQGDSDKMIEAGKRIAEWAPNIAVKLPGTAAGIEAMEELTAMGFTTVGTVSFTVSQAIEIARRQQLGLRRARQAGIIPGKAFTVIMVGRLDDYLRDIAHDMKAPVMEEDIVQAGTACVKRAYEIINKNGYESMLIPAGMRGGYHAVALAGAKMAFSLSANIKSLLLRETVYIENYEEPVSTETIKRLKTIPDFVRAYEPDGLKASEFLTFGVTQRTLSQFIEAGWVPLTELKL